MIRMTALVRIQPRAALVPFEFQSPITAFAAKGDLMFLSVDVADLCSARTRAGHGIGTDQVSEV